MIALCPHGGAWGSLEKQLDNDVDLGLCLSTLDYEVYSLGLTPASCCVNVSFCSQASSPTQSEIGPYGSWTSTKNTHAFSNPFCGAAGAPEGFRVVSASKCLGSHLFQGYGESVERSTLAGCEGANEFPE